MPISAEQARAFDRRAIDDLGVPGAVLMENASRGMAELLLALGIQGRVIVCCGRGNNGGDGFALARHLHMAGVDVAILLFARPEELTGDAALNWRIAERCGVARQALPDGAWDDAQLCHELATAHWVVDALFGSGLKGPVRPPLDRVIAAINACRAKVLAVDIPSGLNADTGQPQGTTLRADHTATVLAPRVGFQQPAAAPFLGRVHRIDLGLPHAALGLSIT